MRTYTWWSLTLMGVILVLLAAQELIARGIDLASLPLVAAALGAAVQRVRFVNEAMRARPRGPRVATEQLITMAVALLAWLYAVVVHPFPTLWALVPALVGGAVVLNLPTAGRWMASLVFTLAAGAAAAAVFPLRAESGYDIWVLCGFGAGFMLIFVLIDVAQLWLWDVVVEVDRARATAGELAVARERLRFASDLHDVQGHHLQAIVLKGELTERLIGRDDEAARAQAADVTELARKALTDTRELVHGYRSTDVQTEITNAVELLRAAGIHTDVHGNAAAIPPPLQQLFGALVREGTTNILRHSHAAHCELTLCTEPGRATVRLSNDGVSKAEGTDGSGIASLRERFATLGGQVTTTHQNGRFELSGQVAEPGGNRP